MYCPDCGRRNDADSQFCSECGTRFAGASERPSTSTLEPHEMVRRASELKDRGELEAAIEACRRAVLSEPRHRGAHALLGLLYERKGQTASAIREYRVVLEIDPNSTAEREKLALLLDEGPGDDRSDFLGPMRARRWPWLVPAIGGAVVVLVVIVYGAIRLANRQGTPARTQVAATQPQRTARRTATRTTPATAPAARPPYPVRPMAASPFGGTAIANAPRTANIPPARRPRLTPPTAARLQAPTTRQVPTRVPTYDVRPPPAIPGIGGGAAGGTRSAVVTPVRESPIGARPEPRAAEGSTGPIEVVGESGAGGTSSRGYIDIRPSGVRAMTPRAATRPAAPAPQPQADARSGRMHQIAAGQLRQQGQYAEAITRYQAAIAAYNDSVENGTADAQARQGIESCERAIAACKAEMGQ